MRVVLHPGFHKTGTSTAEHFLLRNADCLAPFVRVLGQPQLASAATMAKRFSIQRTQHSLDRFTQDWAQCIAKLGSDTPAVFSCVDLFGHIPGHPDIRDYAAAPILLRAMVLGLERRFQDLDLTIHLSTRSPDAWLRSLWLQNLKVHRITEDLQGFSARFQHLAGFDLHALVPAAAPWPIVATPLETLKTHPYGPAGAMLDMVKVPTGLNLVAQPPLKVGFPDDAAKVLLDLNRSEQDDAAVDAAKKDVIALLKRL